MFINASEKIISVDSGGIIKIWDVKKHFCHKTVEAHSDKIWSIRPYTLKNDPEKCSFMTFGSDGQIVIWEDVSKEAQHMKAQEYSKKVSHQQALSNFLQQERFYDALVLTLDLEQPLQYSSYLAFNDK